MREVTIVLNERAYRALHRRAENFGIPIETLAATTIEQRMIATPEYDEVLPPNSPHRSTAVATPPGLYAICSGVPELGEAVLRRAREEGVNLCNWAALTRIRDAIVAEDTALEAERARRSTPESRASAEAVLASWRDKWLIRE